LLLRRIAGMATGSAIDVAVNDSQPSPRWRRDAYKVQRRHA
jgi:hypothetical protein